MNLLKVTIPLLAIAIAFSQVNTKAIASESHDHSEQEDDHDDHEQEENANIGANKGITEVNESQGFKLSAEAIKNFDLKTLHLTKSGPWVIPNSAVLYSAEEVNLYRLRNGFYKRIDFTMDKKNPTDMVIRSKDLKENDEVIVQGIGFLRTAELVATGGAPEGHSH